MSFLLELLLNAKLECERVGQLMSRGEHSKVVEKRRRGRGDSAIAPVEGGSSKKSRTRRGNSIANKDFFYKKEKENQYERKFGIESCKAPAKAVLDTQHSFPDNILSV
ncbi:unnamed protein product [Calypogeia fissa]